jgi:hypothetical protein
VHSLLPVRAEHPGLSGRCIHDFTKALSGQVHFLIRAVPVMLDEVGALREERRRQQQCVRPARLCERGRLSALAGT